MEDDTLWLLMIILCIVLYEKDDNSITNHLWSQKFEVVIEVLGVIRYWTPSGSLSPIGEVVDREFVCFGMQIYREPVGLLKVQTQRSL